jgi:hypothetical protein
MSARTQKDIFEVTEALLKIHQANRFERLAYLAMSLASFLVLLIVAVTGLMMKQISLVQFAALFGATGVIGLCISRVLAVWRDCVELLRAALTGSAR